MVVPTLPISQMAVLQVCPNLPVRLKSNSRKPQIQERLNIEVADALMEYLGAKGAFVVIEAEHMCMSMRGVRKPGTATLTTVARGLFETDKDLRDQAYRLMGL